MAAYYKVEVTLNSQAVQVGLPSPQSVRVTLPLRGPQGLQGEVGPAGPTDFTQLQNVPSTFPPSAHTHVAADVTDFTTAAAAATPVQSVAGRTGTVTLAKADVGLSNVDNTSDLSKPISTAAQTALDGKAALSHTHTASQVTDFNTAAAVAAPVQSVNGNTGTVTVAVPSASTATPQPLGTAAAGTSADFARADHVHPVAGLPIEFVIACSDETSDLATGTAKVTFRAPVAFLLTGVASSVNTAPTGSTLIVDINNGANSTLSTKLSIDASEKTSATAASAAVIDMDYDDIAADAEITIDIDQIGSTIAGKGLKVVLKGVRA
jgi:hypothetical protein